MIKGDLDISGRINLSPTDLEIGRKFTAQRKGSSPETFILLNNYPDDKGKIFLINTERKRPFKASLERFMNGKIKSADIIGAEPLAENLSVSEDTGVNEQVSHPVDLGTNMVFILPKDEGAAVPAVISRIEENGSVILGTPKNNAHLFIANQDALAAGEDENNTYVPVPPKFSVIFSSQQDSADQAKSTEDKPVLAVGSEPLKLDKLQITIDNPEPVIDKPISDLNHNPVNPGERCRLFFKRGFKGALEVVEAFYVGILREARAAKFIVISSAKEEETEPLEPATVRIPLNLLTQRRGVMILPDREKVVDFLNL